MRLFIAIQLNDALKRSAREVQTDFRRLHVKGNFIPPENLHITLAFIGEFGDPDRILELMEGVVFQPFTITMDRIGCFDTLWWTGFTQSSGLESLAGQVRHILADTKVPYDRSRFKPHVTILRKAEFTHGRIEPVTIHPASMTVDKISLMQSTQGKNGRIYTELGSVIMQ